MSQRSRIGLHVSAAGGVEHAPLNAVQMGCEVFQFFSRSPRGGAASPISPTAAQNFRATCEQHALRSAIHAPYYINFASKNTRISQGSVSIIRDELMRGTLLGVPYLMTHLGSKKDLGDRAAIKQTIERIRDIYDTDARWTTELLLEISAGGPASLAGSFEELAEILKGIGRDDVHVCLDSCHVFAAGYDLRTSAAVEETMRAFRHVIPFSRLKLLHANDSAYGLGEHRDRHADIGDGELGVPAFSALLAHPAFKGKDFILETPGSDERRKRDVALLKNLRDDAQ